MKRTFIVAIMVAVIVGLSWYGFNLRYRGSADEDSKPQEQRSAGESHRPAHFAEKQTSTSRAESKQDQERSSGEASEAVGLIVNQSAVWLERVAAAESLSTQLTDHDVEQIFGFLTTRVLSDESSHGQYLKNQLMDVLCYMQPSPDGLGDLLTSIFQDHSQHEVVRDYALQHFASYYEQIVRNTAMDAKARERELSRARDVLWGALDETENSIAGTALLAMVKLAENHPEFGRDDIASAALDIAESRNAGELARITGVQVSAHLGVLEVAPLIMDLAQSAESIPLRIASISALGDIGDSDVVPFLEQIRRSDDSARLKRATDLALESLTKKPAR